MNKNKNIKQLINRDERNSIYNVMYIGISAYKRLLSENSELVKSKSFSEIRTRLLNFIIKRQFEEDILGISFPFKVELRKTNTFNNQALFLKNSNYNLQVNKTKNADKCFNSIKPAKYMLKEARVNSIYSKEIKFFFDGIDDADIREDEKVYIVLGYGVSGDNLTHLSFIIPNEKFDIIIDKFNAINEYNELLMDLENDDDIEDKIMKIKQEAIPLIR